MDKYLTTYKEFLEILVKDPLSLPVWWMLQIQFMLPAILIAHNDEMEKYIGAVSLNGIRSNLCKPYRA